MKKPIKIGIAIASALVLATASFIFFKKQKEKKAGTTNPQGGNSEQELQDLVLNETNGSSVNGSSASTGVTKNVSYLRIHKSYTVSKGWNVIVALKDPRPDSTFINNFTSVTLAGCGAFNGSYLIKDKVIDANGNLAGPCILTTEANAQKKAGSATIPSYNDNQAIYVNGTITFK